MNDDFRYIAAIAKHGSISKAARIEHISQPALSQRLKRLESKLGCELFDRSSQPLVPTELGEVVVRYAQRAIAVEADMRREVHSVLGNKRRRLRAGVSMPRANALLAKPIVEFHESYHDCTLEFGEVDSFEQLHNAFIAHEIDFALLTPITPDPQFYETEVLCWERLMVVMSEHLKVPQIGQAELDRKQVSIRQLEGIPFVLPSCGPYFDPIVAHLIDNQSLQLDIVVRDCDSELALSLAEGGMGATIIPSTYLIGRKSLRSFRLVEAQMGSSLLYIRERGKPLPLEEKRFMSIVKEEIQAMGL